jgi:tol-pal system protein YbgF
VLAALAVLASGCASRSAVDRLESDVGRLRSELAELRVAQETTSRDLASATAQLKALDVKSLGDEVARLNRRADAVDSALADTRSKVEALATPPVVASAPMAAPPLARAPVPAPLPPPAEAEAASPIPAPMPPTPAVMSPTPAPAAPEPAVMTPVPDPTPSRQVIAAAPPQAAAVEKPRVSPAPAVVPAKPAQKAAGNPEQEYAAALATYRAREHGQAVIDFMDFIAKYPKHPLAGNAQYWIGEAYWAQRDYRQALIEFEKVFEHGPAKAPDALLKIGLCHLRLNDVARAQLAWQRVVNEYPKSESATMARSLIATHASARR